MLLVMSSSVTAAACTSGCSPLLAVAVPCYYKVVLASIEYSLWLTLEGGRGGGGGVGEEGTRYYHLTYRTGTIALKQHTMTISEVMGLLPSC